MILLIQYPKCSTCQKARKWLVEHNVSFTDRHIVEDNPSAKELASWIKTSGLPVKKFFNTSGMKYKEMGLKDRLRDLFPAVGRQAVKHYRIVFGDLHQIIVDLINSFKSLVRKI